MAIVAGSTATVIASRMFRIPPFTACAKFRLPDELDAE